jgi:GNAT superfamily N-acetyltransferase
MIRHAFDEAAGGEDENRFEALDDVENIIGSARVEARKLFSLYPRQPLRLRVTASGDAEAAHALLGAATARALKLAKADASLGARVYFECDPDDADLIGTLKAFGYEDDDGVVQMRRRLMPGPLARPLPEGCTVVRDYLLDDVEARYFLERYNAMFGEDRDMAWLANLRQKNDFSRILLVSPDGLAGEALLWSDGFNGVVGAIQTTPAWRRKGVATYILELARIFFLEHGIYRSALNIWLRLTPAGKLAYSLDYEPGKMIIRYPGIDVNLKARRGRAPVAGDAT